MSAHTVALHAYTKTTTTPATATATSAQVSPHGRLRPVFLASILPTSTP